MLRKVEFLDRLFKLSGCFEELCTFLKDEKLIDDPNLKFLQNEAERSRWLINYMEKLKKEDKVMLLDYEWQVLPIERLKLTIVTDKVNREFKYNA